MQKYEDSQEYLVEHPHLACEETANYLVLWCIDLEIEEVKWSGFLKMWLRHRQTAKALISLHIRAIWSRPDCQLNESLETIEYTVDYLSRSPRNYL